MIKEHRKVDPISISQIFDFEGVEVRVVGTIDAPEWVAQDICACLGLADTSKAVETLEPDEKDTKNVRTLGGNQEMLTVTEAGLYRLIFKSRKPVAKRFQRWVFHEVLPAIRKNSTYSINSTSEPTECSLRLLPVDAIATASAVLKKAGISGGQVASWELGQYAKYDSSNAPVYEDGKRLLSSQMAIQEVPMSPTEIGKEIALKMNWPKVPSAQKVNQALIDAGLQVAERSFNSKGKPRVNYHLTEIGKRYGETVIDTARGHGKTVFHVRWFKSVIPVVSEYFQQCEGNKAS